MRATPAITPRDRLGLTLFLAVAVHAIVIFGITFTSSLPGKRNIMPTLDVTLVQTRSLKPPEQADYIAQANQDGGGNVEEKVRPSSPAPSLERVPDPDVSPLPPVRATPPQQATDPKPQVLTAAKAPEKVRAEKQSVRRQDTTPVTAVDLYTRSLEMASLSSEINKSLQAYAQRPRQAFISARTREHKYAAYMDDWVAKVERVGNLNYPEQARRRGISGDLILDVALRADGTVQSISLLRSSGHKFLDDAAIRIVELAAPFAPFPEEIRKDTDILHISRTWQFLDNHQLLGH